MIGIVILNYNTYKETTECVQSIYQYSDEMDNKSIYVVDNGSTDNSNSMLEELYRDTNITIIKSDKNLGFSGGNNLGIKKAIEDGCDQVFLLNSDVVLLNDAIGIMSAYLQEHPNIPVVGPSIINTLGEYSQVARTGLTFLDIFLKNRRLYKFDKDREFVFSGMCHGCCFGLKTEFIQKYHFLDDNIFLYCEEDSIAHVIAKNDLFVCIVPTAKVLHIEGASVGKKTPEVIARGRYFRWKSEIYVLQKYANCSSLKLRIVLIYRNIIILFMKTFYPQLYVEYIGLE